MVFIFKCEFCIAVGTRNNTSLSEDSVFIGRHANRFERREHNIGKVGQKQTETDHDGTGRKVGKRIESSQICRMLGIDTGTWLMMQNPNITATDDK